MSWMQKLYETYEACEKQGRVGDRDENPMLLPLYHGTQQAQMEVKIDREGNWLPGNAVAVDKKDQETLVLTTEKSSNRTSSPEPMPLFDKLVYVAGDYGIYCADRIKKEKEATPYELYLEALRRWCASAHACQDVISWLRYVEKGCLIADLLSEGIFKLDENGLLLDKWEGTGKAADVFIRIRVQMPEAIRKTGGQQKNGTE